MFTSASFKPASFKPESWAGLADDEKSGASGGGAIDGVTLPPMYSPLVQPRNESLPCMRAVMLAYGAGTIR